MTKVASYYMGTHLGYKGVHRDLVTGFSFVLIVELLFGKWISFIIVLKRFIVILLLLIIEGILASSLIDGMIGLLIILM